MPHYDYKCVNPDCQHEMVVFETIVSDPKQHCPICNHNSLKRLIGKGAGVIFKKGSGGFYSKDYGGKNASDVSKGDK